MGVHIILDLFGCPDDKLKDARVLEKICQNTVKDANLSILKSNFHQFKPHGATGTMLLAESHLSVHTWPEHKSVAADIFCCFLNEGNIEKAKEKAEMACKSLIKNFQPREINKNVKIR